MAVSAAAASVPIQEDQKTAKLLGKSFRLFDFVVGDLSNDDDDDDDDDDDSGDKKKSQTFSIQMFGINERGDTCSITVRDFLPFFFVKGGDHWGPGAGETILRVLRLKCRKSAHDIVKAERVERKKLYGFTGGLTFSFFKITFATLKAFRDMKRLWQKAPVKVNGVALELYESNIPPLLRFFHIYNLSPSGWIFLRLDHNVVIRRPGTTSCTFECSTVLANVIPQPDKETPVPYKICSFDIEASSSHGDFPLPVKTYKRLATNVMDMAVRRSAVLDAPTVKRILLTAFGYDTMENVDRVFPKQMPTRETVKTLADRLIVQTIHDLVNEGNVVERDHIMEIDALFRAKQQEDDDDAETTAAATGRKRQLPASSSSSLTLIQVLYHDKLTREAKIQFINDALTYAFPILEGDEVTYIGSTFLRCGEAEPYLNHCLVSSEECGPVDGVVLETASCERNLLLQWRNLILRENPDILIGYNIFGFDWEFLFRRSQETDCMHEFMKLSRNVNECGATLDYRTQTVELGKTQIVLATGEYDLRYPVLSGRLQIDLYTYFRRDFNLASYKLDDVASANICDDIFRVCLGDNVTELHTRNVTGLHVGDFIHIELSGFTSDYYGGKLGVLELRKAPEGHYIIVVPGIWSELVDMPKKMKWGVAKDDLTPQDLFRMSKGTALERALVAKYCVQDCNLVHHLMRKLDVLTGYSEMARICSVPMSFLVFRGQGIKLTSFVAKKCREKNTLMPDLAKKDGDDDDGGYEGAIVLPPKCSMYMDNPVACVDYSSLYPSSMISQNYSHDSKVWSKEYDLAGELVKETGDQDLSGNYMYDNLPGYQYIDVEFDTFQYKRKTPTSRPEKTVVGKKVCRWAQLDNQKSIMPSILEELLQARKKTRKAAEAEADPFMANILDKRQLGYKVTANSLYGQCGAKTSTFYEQDVAASTTATGRAMIMYAKHMVEDVYGDRVVHVANHGDVQCRAEYVYGDTDSVFFTFHLQDPATGAAIRGPLALKLTIALAQDVAALCTQFLKPPMELSYEKTLMPFILLSKKRYVGMLYENNPQKGKLKYMGLSLKRRDSCDYLKDVYGGILTLLMSDQTTASCIDLAIAFLDNALDALIRGDVAMEKLTITKALRSDYKNPLQIGHWVLAERMGQRDPGNKPKPGDRMRFVFVQQPAGKKALMGNCIETPDFVVANHLKVDYAHYITNQLMKPLQQLFGLALVAIWKSRGKEAMIRTYLRDVAALERECGGDLELFMKKKEKYCAEKVKTLLFEKHLVKISNDHQRLQSIRTFFNPV